MHSVEFRAFLVRLIYANPDWVSSARISMSPKEFEQQLFLAFKAGQRAAALKSASPSLFSRIFG
jgi:hypothetical protein